MPRKAPEFHLSHNELHDLNQLVNAHKTPQQIVTRANILRALHEQTPLTHYTRDHELSTNTIATWRDRWLNTRDTE